MKEKLNIKELEKLFHTLRNNEKTHLGLGDVRVTIGEQQAIIDEHYKVIQCIHQKYYSDFSVWVDMHKRAITTEKINSDSVKFILDAALKFIGERYE